MEKLEVHNPRTGGVVGVHPVADRDEVEAAVARARECAVWWGGLEPVARRDVLDRWRHRIVRGMGDLADLVHQETGKPRADAMLEIGMAVDHLAWAAREAGNVLGLRKVPSGLAMANHAATVEYLPLGVVGVIGPWNYPVFTPMGSISYALAAGNAVVFKPSELTPGAGLWLAERLEEVLEGQALFQVVVGSGETGEALCRSAVDKVAFTGSTATGKRVMAACAERLTPVVIEAGGKDAVLVDEDADVVAAAEATAWGAFSNAGQTCTGVERVYVHHAVAERFLAELVERAGRVVPGQDYGPMTLHRQVEVIQDHVADALARGGRAVVGGVDPRADGLVAPTVLVGVPEDSRAVTEETFGPTVTVTTVASMDEAVDLANATRYGLGSTVFSGSRGPELARRLRTGMTSVNSVISFVAVPSLPFGGVGDSGFGRVHGADGLKEFTYAKAVARQRTRPLLTLTTLDRTPRADAAFAVVVRLLHGGTVRLPGLPGLAGLRRRVAGFGRPAQ